MLLIRPGERNPDALENATPDAINPAGFTNPTSWVAANLTAGKKDEQDETLPEPH